MSSSKYSTFLTVLLIVAIIAIIVLLGFFGYDVYSKMGINKGAEDAISRFENSIKEEQEQSIEETKSNDNVSSSVASPLSSVSQSNVNYSNKSVLEKNNAASFFS